MSKEQFMLMSLQERMRWIYFNGEFVTSIRYYKYKINLYILDRLYIELFYHSINDLVEKIEVLDNHSKRMKFYADQIKLPSDIRKSNKD
jgi:hypothetical protein